MKKNNKIKIIIILLTIIYATVVLIFSSYLSNLDSKPRVRCHNGSYEIYNASNLFICGRIHIKSIRPRPVYMAEDYFEEYNIS